MIADTIRKSEIVQVQEKSEKKYVISHIGKAIAAIILRD
jgi:hypothetical protein